MVSRASVIPTGEARPAAGIAFVIIGVTFLSFNDALVKYLGEFYPTGQVVFFRTLFALPLIAGVAFYMVGGRMFRPRRPGFHLFRGLLITLALFSYYLGLTLMPLAEAVAIVFAAPLFITVLAVPLLGERPRPSQWLATLAGFCGVLLIVRPGTEAFTLAAILPLITAIGYALFMMSARFLQQDENLWVTMVYVSAVPLAIAAVLLPWFWMPLDPGHLPYFLATGLAGGLGITLISHGFRIASASLVAPFEYIGMLWAILFGWMFWAEIPGGSSILGITLIVACGLHLAWNHGRRRRLAAQDRLPRT